MELHDKYFHSIHSYGSSYEDTLENIEMRLDKLSRILESGAILCKEKCLPCSINSILSAEMPDRLAASDKLRPVLLLGDAIVCRCCGVFQKYIA